MHQLQAFHLLQVLGLEALYLLMQLLNNVALFVATLTEPSTFHWFSLHPPCRTENFAALSPPPAIRSSGSACGSASRSGLTAILIGLLHIPSRYLSCSMLFCTSSSLSSFRFFSCCSSWTFFLLWVLPYFPVYQLLHLLFES